MSAIMTSPQCVYANDEFEYELGLNSKLFHKPALGERGEMVAVYALFKLQNGGYGFEVMSKQDVDSYAQKYSKAINSSFSPWKSAYTEMAMKTVIKRVLRYAPLKTDFLRAVATDETIKDQFSVDMTEIHGNEIIDVDEGEVLEVA